MKRRLTASYHLNFISSAWEQQCCDRAVLAASRQYPCSRHILYTSSFTRRSVSHRGRKGRRRHWDAALLLTNVATSGICRPSHIKISSLRGIDYYGNEPRGSKPGSTKSKSTSLFGASYPSLIIKILYLDSIAPTPTTSGPTFTCYHRGYAMRSSISCVPSIPSVIFSSLEVVTHVLSEMYARYHYAPKVGGMCYVFRLVKLLYDSAIP
ncbi:hypothetical protein F5X97DRAFT_159044 [Nemania serpens]|nr:hypothetical protein F5X97DRAFT_159044 [Nemania serpens]